MKLFIQGISSWTAHYAIPYIRHEYPRLEMHGTFRSHRPQFEEGHCTLYPIDRNSDCLPIVEEVRPDYFLHLARGEEDEDFVFHQNLIPILNRLGIHYSFASSFNAVDSNTETDHMENELAHAQTGYGKFKAQCENELMEKSQSFAIFRFAAVHGWAPGRLSRTESFLQKLQAGEEVTVDRGVLQNRPFVGYLACMMIDTILAEGQGVFHLGPEDASEELVFLRHLAEEFGYSQHQIIEGQLTPINAFMIPGKIYEMFGDRWRFREGDTIREIVKTPELQKYRSAK
ncbi:MAG: sugar nucleotide-binding protein [Bdellovibrionaceae bacterium]|nr:sugar nucleotide-binding protein [Bdellovibrionales bacterium]MCB9083251.1 sugar nucleotide-binding protein [Pseudobdellovibrionaceae bacterium]